MASNSGGYSGAKMAELDAAVYEMQPTVARCAFCPEWLFEGGAADARLAQEEHRRQEHPETFLRPRRRQRMLVTFRQREMSDAQVEEIEAERQRRARLLGLELS